MNAARITWAQAYDPLGNLFLSALVAALPVVVLLGLLGLFQVRAYVAALCGLASALVIAIWVFQMPPVLAAAAAGYGVAYGLFPIGWIVLNAIFIYDVTVKTGKFEVVKHGIAALAGDRRIQALLIAFAFGAFIEGAAGFGTPVAISGALLVGLGFKPLTAAGLALLGNTAPVAYGGLGTPLIALSKVTELDLGQLSAMVGRQLPFFSLLVPFWLVAVMSGWRGLVEVWPACLVAGGTFAVSQFLVSNFHGPWLVDVVSAIVSMAGVVMLLRFWQPRTVWRFEHERGESCDESCESGDRFERSHPSRRDSLVAWMPWVLLCVFVFTWGLTSVKKRLEQVGTVSVAVPFLDQSVVRMPPVVPKPKREEAVFNLNALSATGTALLLTGLVAGLLLKLTPAALLRLYWHTLVRVSPSLLTIAAMLALGFATRYSGLDTTMGLAFARSGRLFPFFSPLLGWLGVALTGSDTASNVLFGNLQQVAAGRIGVPALLTAAANSSGGVMGKMIDAQSIVVASAATETMAAGPAGDEAVTPARILRFVFVHSIALAVLVGLLVLLQAYAVPWMIPESVTPPVP